MSPKLMRNILLRYILVFFAILPFFIASALYYLSKRINFEWVTTYRLLLFETLSLLLALCIVIIRTCEPFVFEALKEIGTEGLLCRPKAKKTAEKSRFSGALSERITQIKYN